MDLSSLSDVEYVQIIANYNNADKDDEEQVLRDRGYSEDKIRYVLKDKQGTSYKSLNVVFHTTKLYKYPRFTYIYGAYTAYKNGILPTPGSFSEQPAKLIDIFNTLQQLEFEAKEAAQKALQKKRKHG